MSNFRINFGQKFVLREIRCVGKANLIATSDKLEPLRIKALLLSSKQRPNKLIGYSIKERTGGGRNSEKLIENIW